MPNGYKIKDRYSYCIDQYIDLDRLHLIYPKIAKGIACSKFNLYASNPPENTLLQPVESLKIFSEFFGTEEYHRLRKSGSTDESIMELLCMMHNIEFPTMQLFLRVPVENPQDYEMRQEGPATKDLHGIEHFHSLLDWIDDSEIFESVGLIVIFVSRKGSKTYPHRDYDINGGFKKTQGIWINYFENKAFYVLDDNWDKHYITGEVNIFEQCSLHASDPANLNCFSIRIDGKFTDEFIQRIGLKEYYET